MAAELRFGVMGTQAHLVVVGAEPAPLLEHGRLRLEELHRRWSRFAADSELSQLNGARGKPTIVSADTYRVICEAVQSWHATGGLFDPSVHDTLCALGYDRSFDGLVPTDRPVPAPPAPGCAGIEFTEAIRAISLPVGVALDLGGIGKGAAADLVADELIDLGARGACVNVGGDVRVRGSAPTAAGWVVALACPGAQVAPVGRVALANGAVCTTTSLKRRWRSGGREVHHVIDPKKADSAQGLCSVTVVAARATQAEVLCKAAFVAGPVDGPRWIADHGCAGILVEDDGSTIVVGSIEEMAA